MRPEKTKVHYLYLKRAVQNDSLDKNTNNKTNKQIRTEMKTTEKGEEKEQISKKIKNYEMFSNQFSPQLLFEHLVKFSTNPIKWSSVFFVKIQVWVSRNSFFTSDTKSMLHP